MKHIRLFFGGDICGSFGLEIALKTVPHLIEQEEIDFTVINGENAAEGSGITPEQAAQLFSVGVDVITGGNHSLERFELRNRFGEEKRILRPANYPFAPGSGSFTVQKDGIPFTILNMQGRENMRMIDCPFQTADVLLAGISGGVVMVDFHAESVQEKEAFAYCFDGQVSCVFGSHTHVQTADERILPNGTGYISDAGMIGSAHSVIGGSIEAAIQRSLTLVPQPRSVENTGSGLFCGIIASICPQTYKTLALKRIYLTDV